MNILGISGSPRKRGNTAYAMQYALDLLRAEHADTRYISLSEKTIHPCTGCWHCTKTKQCTFDDDMTEIIEAMRWCDGLVVGSPVYIGMISAQLKAVIDRSVLLRVGEPGFEMAGKIGCGIACGGFRNGGQELTLVNIQTFLLQHNMLAISDGPRYSHSGATIVGEAQSDEVGLKTIDNLMYNLTTMLTTRTGP